MINTYQESFREVIIDNLHSNSFLMLYNFETKNALKYSFVLLSYNYILNRCSLS